MWRASWEGRSRSRSLSGKRRRTSSASANASAPPWWSRSRPTELSCDRTAACSRLCSHRRPGSPRWPPPAPHRPLRPRDPAVAGRRLRREGPANHPSRRRGPPPARPLHRRRPSRPAHPCRVAPQRLWIRLRHRLRRFHRWSARTPGSPRYRRSCRPDRPYTHHRYLRPSRRAGRGPHAPHSVPVVVDRGEALVSWSGAGP